MSASNAKKRRLNEDSAALQRWKILREVFVACKTCFHS